MKQSEPAYSGLYINLDRSPERRAAFEKQLSELGLQSRYGRFPSVDGRQIDTSRTQLRPGEVGLFLSHCRALESARNRGSCVHVLEDDALLSEHVVPVVSDAVATDVFQQYDLLFTDMMIHCHIAFLKSVKSEFDQIAPRPRPLRFNQLRLIDLSQVFYAGSQSYVVGARSIDKVISVYREEIAKGPTIPVDIFLQQQVLSGRLRAACLFPFITSFRLEDVMTSTIEHETDASSQASEMVMAVLRYLFFVNADLAHAQRVLDAATRPNRKPADERHALITQATEFVLSDDFQGS
jgi:GR25 family glycosyltransferase involved in LPS biosynthesis